MVRCASVSIHIDNFSSTGATTWMPWVRSYTPCVCSKPPTVGLRPSNSNSPCSSATVPKASRRSSVCSMRHARWVPSPSWTACTEGCPTTVSAIRRRLLQTGRSLAGRCHHVAAVLRRTFARRRHQRRPQQRAGRIHRIVDLQSGGGQPADRHPPEQGNTRARPWPSVSPALRRSSITALMAWAP